MVLYMSSVFTVPAVVELVGGACHCAFDLHMGSVEMFSVLVVRRGFSGGGETFFILWCMVACGDEPDFFGVLSINSLWDKFDHRKDCACECSLRQDRIDWERTQGVAHTGCA